MCVFLLPDRVLLLLFWGGGGLLCFCMLCVCMCLFCCSDDCLFACAWVIWIQSGLFAALSKQKQADTCFCCLSLFVACVSLLILIRDYCVVLWGYVLCLCFVCLYLFLFVELMPVCLRLALLDSERFICCVEHGENKHQCLFLFVCVLLRVCVFLLFVFWGSVLLLCFVLFVLCFVCGCVLFVCFCFCCIDVFSFCLCLALLDSERCICCVEQGENTNTCVVLFGGFVCYVCVSSSVRSCLLFKKKMEGLCCCCVVVCLCLFLFVVLMCLFVCIWPFSGFRAFYLLR